MQPNLCNISFYDSLDETFKTMTSVIEEEFHLESQRNLSFFPVRLLVQQLNQGQRYARYLWTNTGRQTNVTRLRARPERITSTEFITFTAHTCYVCHVMSRVFWTVEFNVFITFIIQQNVLGLQVSVDDSFLVKMFHSLDDLSSVITGSWFGESWIILIYIIDVIPVEKHLLFITSWDSK